MITTKKLFSALVALTISVAMVSCSGDDGEQGPAGPAGSDGNANVNAYTYTVAGTDWTMSGNYLRDTLNIAEITSDVAKNGDVRVFYSIDINSSGVTDSTVWTETPTRQILGFGTQGEMVSFESSYSIGQVFLRLIRESGQSFGLSVPINYKVVIIPSSAMVDGVDPTDYKALEAVYGLE